MKKMLIATTALTSFAVAAPALAVDVTISGGVEWRYVSIGDDIEDDNAGDGERTSTTDFNGTQNATISMSTTSDSGLTFGASIVVGDDGTKSSHIKGDFGTIEFSEGSGGAHAASSYDVTSVGIAGGHGDPAFALLNKMGSKPKFSAANSTRTAADTKMTSKLEDNGTITTSTDDVMAGLLIGYDEAQINDPENGALNYHSPSFSGFSFGVGTSHLTHGDKDSTTSYGLKYSGGTDMMDDGMMGGITYEVGVAGYDGGDDVGGSHFGFTVTSGDLTLGYGQASNENGVAWYDGKAVSNQEDVTSYSINYKMLDGRMTLNAGHATSENDVLKAEATNMTFGVAYTIVPGLAFSISSHNFEYTDDTEANKNEGSAIQSELKMSF